MIYYFLGYGVLAVLFAFPIGKFFSSEAFHGYDSETVGMIVILLSLVWPFTYILALFIILAGIVGSYFTGR